MYCRRLSPRIRQREAEQGVRLSVVRCLQNSLFGLRESGIGIDPRPLRLTEVLVHLRPDQAPAARL